MPGQQRRERKLRSFLGARFWHTAPCACIVTPAGRTGSRHFLTRDERSALPAAAAGWCTPRRMSSIACWPRCRSGSGYSRFPFPALQPGLRRAAGEGCPPFICLIRGLRRNPPCGMLPTKQPPPRPPTSSSSLAAAEAFGGALEGRPRHSMTARRKPRCSNSGKPGDRFLRRRDELTPRLYEQTFLNSDKSFK